MSAIIAKAAAAPQRRVPSIAPFISSLPGSYQRTEEAAPAQKAPHTSHLVIRKA